MNSRNLLTLVQAADRLGVTPDTLRQQIHNGVLKAEKISRDWFVTESEIERYAIENCRTATPRASEVSRE